MMRVSWLAMTVIAAAGALSVGCGDSPVQPSNPSPPPASTENPVVRVSVKADESGARDAIVGLSETIVDASASTGTGTLTFAIDFGDGARATTATARHVYAAPGTFTVTVEARDAQGRTSSSSQQVSVKALSGSWFHAGYNVNVHRVEIRRIEITSHEGQTVRGLYKLSHAPDRPFTGTLKPPRSISLVADTTTLEGLIPGRLNDESEPWPLLVRGAGLNGDRLDFRAIVGVPAGPEPEADLRIRMDSLGSPVAIVSLSPIDFDGTRSRGTALSYFLEFGDDQTSTQPRAVHAASRSGELTARLTVVDRFGRHDTESIPYWVFTLAAGMLDGWFYGDSASSLAFRFAKRTGVNYEGTASYWFGGPSGLQAPCFAVLSGDRDIRIVVPSLGLEFRGHLDMSTSVFSPGGATIVSPPMTVTQFGGAHDGKVWTLRYDDGPG